MDTSLTKKLELTSETAQSFVRFSTTEGNRLKSNASARKRTCNIAEYFLEYRFINEKQSAHRMNRAFDTLFEAVIDRRKNYPQAKNDNLG